MQISKEEVRKLLKADVGYTDATFDQIRLVVKNFYSRLHNINRNREDFHKREILSPKAKSAVVPARDLTEYDFLGAVSRLIYGNNKCVAISNYKGGILLATNIEDYSADVTLVGLRSNNNEVYKYIKWIADLSFKAGNPLWVDNKFLHTTYIHENLAANLSSIIAAKFADCKRQEDIIKTLDRMYSEHGGKARKICCTLDHNEDFAAEWDRVIKEVIKEFEFDSKEAEICRNYTKILESEKVLDDFKELAILVLKEFFTFKSSNYSGDIIENWRKQFISKCPDKYKKIYKNYINGDVRDYLKDLLILEAFVSHHLDNNVIKAIINSKGKVKIIDNEGNEVPPIATIFPEYLPKSPLSALEVEGIKTGNIHAEMKILQYQMKNGGFASYIAVSKLCCAFCHLTLDSIDNGSKDQYPGSHGTGQEFKLSEWMKKTNAYNSFLEKLLRVKDFKTYCALTKTTVTLNDAKVVNGRQLTLVLIENLNKLFASDQSLYEELIKDYPCQPQKVKDACTDTSF